MEFGHVAPEELASINFGLPEDPEQTIKTLRESTVTENFDLRIGASKWGNKEWLGSFYPAKIKESEFLQEYVKHFNGIFLNATFYQVYGPDQILKWKALSDENPDFKFFTVVSQSISHIRRLKNAEEFTAKYIAGIEAFGDKLGFAMLQLGDNFTYKSFPELKAYLEAWPKKIQLFVELRHKDWWTPEWMPQLVSLFNINHIGFTITDAPGRRDCVHMQLTIPHTVIRFVSTGGDDNDLDKKRLDEWAARIKDWKSKGLQSAGFFIGGHNDRHTPALCNYFISKMNA